MSGRLTQPRSDGRREVADMAEANRRYGCSVDTECILVDRHDGQCSQDREVWAGADQPYPAKDDEMGARA